MRSPLGSALVVATLATVLVSALACGTDAVGIQSCRNIEHARCRRAAGCGIDLTVPVHRDSPNSDVDACIRFYDDACLHGLAAPSDPGNVAVQACVMAIETGSCDVVKTPESSPACAFLVPPATPATDAAADTAPTDAGPTDASGG